MIKKIDKIILLVGLMGSGKTSVGKRLAKKLNLPFVDGDQEIEKAAGLSLVDVLKCFGEEEYRAGEKRVMKRLLQVRRGAAACSCPNLSGAAADQAALDALSAQFPRLAPRLEELAREEQRAACRILLQRADWDGAALAFTLCRL